MCFELELAAVAPNSIWAMRGISPQQAEAVNGGASSDVTEENTATHREMKIPWPPYMTMLEVAGPAS
jgi:hypothetical protein